MLKHKLLTEILWLLIAAVITIAVLIPVSLSVGDFPYQWENAFLIFGFVTLVRLLFFHKQAPWLQPKVMKGVVCVAMVPVFLYTMLTINTVQTFVDANGFAALFNVLESDIAIQWGRYIRNEVVFFGAGLLVCCVILPVVLIIEVWRQVKGYA
ncbi:MAG: hypothetical protein AB8F78_19635 [Saprospiraceae bacterium]